MSTRRLNTQKPILVIVRWLWTIAQGNRLQMILNAVIGIAQVVASLLSVYVVKHAIDVASHEVAGNLYVAILAMGIIILIDFALSISSVWVRNLLGIKAQNHLQQKMLARVLRSEWQARHSRHSGDTINRLEGDVGVVVGFLTETLPSALSTLLLFVGAFAYLYTLDSLLALITIAIVPLCILLSKFYVRRMRELNRDVRASDSKIQSVMQESVQHAVTIKTLESGGTMLGKLSASHAELRQNVIRRTIFSVLSNLTLNFGFALSYLLAFAWSAVRLSAGTLTFGGMTAFLQLVSKIQGPARSLAKLLPRSVAVLTAAERLMELEDVPEEEEGESVTIDAPCGVYFDNVTFCYGEGEETIFSKFSYSFNPGTATAIVGETGVGKTTLIRLLLSLAHPSEGSVRIGRTKQESEEITHLHRCNFIYVPQGNTLMSGTIRENLLLGNPTATEDEMLRAIKDSCADFVFMLPDKLDTLCNEQGGGLSEGQMQRITIARALLRNSAIMLFDEATSALDQETERVLLQNLMSYKDKTIIFITHRMAVCEHCTDVLRL